jgi:membrane fusion protein, multidrug efflux system
MRHGNTGLGWLALLTVLAAGCGQGQAGPTAPPALPVAVAAVTQQDVPVYSEWIASTDGSVNAVIRAQAQGYLIAQRYKEGDLVEKGQLLFEIDPRPFQATLDHALAAEQQAVATEQQAVAALHQAEATLEQSKAEVAKQEALWVNAKANYDRFNDLVGRGAVAKKDVDDATGAERSTNAGVASAKANVIAAQAAIGVQRAAVAAAQASIAAARAAAEKARVDLGFTKIVSPVTGITGIAKAQLGNLVGPGSTEELTTVSALDPIKVYVPMSEQEYLARARQGPDSAGGPIELVLADGSRHPQTGRIAFADRQVDVQTGTIKVAVLFPNPGNLLRPGQFARVRAQRSVKQGALLVPQRAVMELQGSYQVAIVGQDQKVDIRPIKVGQQVNGLWVIEHGVQRGDQVVVEGLQKIRPGMAVTPMPYAAAPGGSPANATGAEPITKASAETPAVSSNTPDRKAKR